MLLGFLITSGIILGSAIYNKWRFQLPKGLDQPKNLPTVSLLIPARNETHAITKALDNALALKYPKLEIIVLDDQSSDDTSEKIRSFAQRGVRFISGQALPDGWVGKTFACHQLSQAASGEYLVFCDVDVFFGPESLTSLIKLMENRQLECVSVQPKFLSMGRWSVLIEPLQAFFFHVLPIKSLGLMRVFSGLLIIKQSAYIQSGGHRLRSGKILPEIALSKYFQDRGRYHFLTAGKHIQVVTIKKSSSLNESRQRYYYPLFSESPHTIALLGIIAPVLPLILLALPDLYGWMMGGVLMLAAGISSIGLRPHPFLNALALPINFLWEVNMFISSLWRYRFSKVTWKGRRLQQPELPAA